MRVRVKGNVTGKVQASGSDALRRPTVLVLGQCSAPLIGLAVVDFAERQGRVRELNCDRVGLVFLVSMPAVRKRRPLPQRAAKFQTPPILVAIPN